jgi:hypothetical protein
MSTPKFSRQLNLNKKTLVNLSKDQLKNVIGGETTKVQTAGTECCTMAKGNCSPGDSNVTHYLGGCKNPTLANETMCSSAINTGVGCTSGCASPSKEPQ